MIHGERSRELLNEYVEKLVVPITKRKGRLALYDHLKLKFDMDAGTASDIVCLKRDMAEFTAFQLFAVVYCLKRNDLGMGLIGRLTSESDAACTLLFSQNCLFVYSLFVNSVMKTIMI